MVYFYGMYRWSFRGSRITASRLAGWRREVTALAVLVMAAGLAVLVAFLTQQAWAPVVVTVVVGLPGLYLAFLAVPGVIIPSDPGAGKTAYGRLVGQWNPLDLGVHQVIGGGPLPRYVSRPHDELLRAVIDPAVTASRLVVLRGGSSTGKSRAAWESIAAQLPSWQLDYPRDPAALRQRLDAGVPDRTVLWLGELRQYAEAEGGEQVLGRLADLLHSEGRLLVTTVWPEHWNAYTSAAHSGTGPAGVNATAGRLLQPLPQLAGCDAATVDPARGGVIDVPPEFTAADLRSAANTRDQALTDATAAAAAAGLEGQVTQYLAGVPDLLERYNGLGGDPYGQAVISAAMDAARLGHASPLPAELLQEAAVGYLTELQRTKHIEIWRNPALDWASQELRGAIRALQPLAPDGGTGVVGYQVADYLDQYGRSARRDQLGQASLWDSLVSHTSGIADLIRLAESARYRGLYRHSATLLTAAAAQGSANAAVILINILRVSGVAGSDRAVAWATAHVTFDDPFSVYSLLQVLREVGADDAVAILARRAAAGIALDDPDIVGLLLEVMREVRADDAVTILLDRALAAHVSLDDPQDVRSWLHTLREVRADDAVMALGCQAAAGVALEDPGVVGSLLRALREVGADDAVTILLDRDPAAHVTLANQYAVNVLLGVLRDVGADDAAIDLGCRAAAHISLDDPHAVGSLLRALREVGADDAVTVLLDRDPAAHASLDDSAAAFSLLRVLREVGADDAVTVLLNRDPAAHASLDDPHAVGSLLRALREVGADDAVTVLLNRDPAAHASLDDPHAVGSLLRALREVGADDAVTILLNRDPAAHASLDDPAAVCSLLRVLREVGAEDAAIRLGRRAAVGVTLADLPKVNMLIWGLRQVGAHDAVTTLTRRTAVGITIEDPDAVGSLLGVLHEVGADDAVTILLDRDPAAHVSLDSPLTVSWWLATDDAMATLPPDAGSVDSLLKVLREIGANDALAILARRAAVRVILDDPHDVGYLLRFMRGAGADDAVTILLDRDPAAHVTLANPHAVNWLLGVLREVGADDAAIDLGCRAAARVSLDDPHAVGSLLEMLREAGAANAVAALSQRAAASTQFSIFMLANPHEVSTYRAGREPNGAPSQPWGWTDGWQ